MFRKTYSKFTGELPCQRVVSLNLKSKSLPPGLSQIDLGLPLSCLPNLLRDYSKFSFVWYKLITDFVVVTIKMLNKLIILLIQVLIGLPYLFVFDFPTIFCAANYENSPPVFIPAIKRDYFCKNCYYSKLLLKAVVKSCEKITCLIN